jgi:hypothetical protein
MRQLRASDYRFRYRDYPVCQYGSSVWLGRYSPYPGYCFEISRFALGSFPDDDPLLQAIVPCTQTH